MARRGALIVALLIACWGSPPAFALPDWEFSLLPANGEIAGPPGSTLGWGQTLTNLDPDAWLSLSGLSSDPVANGTALSLFDFPTLAPGESLAVPFVADTQGLFQLTWDLTAPVGTVETGAFLLTADWYDADAFTGGQFLDTAATLTAAYVATMTEPPANPVPEPNTLLLLAAGLAGMGGDGVGTGRMDEDTRCSLYASVARQGFARIRRCQQLAFSQKVRT